MSKLRNTIDNFVCLGPTVHITARHAYSYGMNTDATHYSSGAPTLAPSLAAEAAAEAANGKAADSQDAPDLIIITSWTGALPKHIAKYTEAYKDIFPTAPVLLVTTSVGDLTDPRPFKKKAAVLEPALRFIETLILSRNTEHFNIFLHSFSDGGSYKATTLARAFVEHAGYRLPIAATLFDSSPGSPRFSSNMAALKRTLPKNWAVRLVPLVLGTAWLVAAFGFHRGLLRGREQKDVLTKTRRAMNDTALWPVAGVARTYLFSEADDLIAWRDVLDHAELSARQHGVVSLVVKYDSTAHCNHMRGNEDHYWGVVRKTWEGRNGVDLSHLASAGYNVDEPEV
jgi:hypothetical protein